MPAMCPTFESAVSEVIKKHEATDGCGVRCYVWVWGPGKVTRVETWRFNVGPNGLNLNGTLGDDLKAIPGYRSHTIQKLVIASTELWVNID